MAGPRRVVRRREEDDVAERDRAARDGGAGRVVAGPRRRDDRDEGFHDGLRVEREERVVRLSWDRTGPAADVLPEAVRCRAVFLRNRGRRGGRSRSRRRSRRGRRDRRRSRSRRPSGRAGRRRDAADPCRRRVGAAGRARIIEEEARVARGRSGPSDPGTRCGSARSARLRARSRSRTCGADELARPRRLERPVVDRLRLGGRIIHIVRPGLVVLAGSVRRRIAVVVHGLPDLVGGGSRVARVRQAVRAQDDPVGPLALFLRVRVPVPSMLSPAWWSAPFVGVPPAAPRPGCAPLEKYFRRRNSSIAETSPESSESIGTSGL